MPSLRLVKKKLKGGVDLPFLFVIFGPMARQTTTIQQQPIVSPNEEVDYLLFPIYSENKNGILHIIRGNAAQTHINSVKRKFLVVEEGLFLVGTFELTRAEIKTKYNIVLPEYY